jgi:glutathionyl-hydroquinone reductase
MMVTSRRLRLVVACSVAAAAAAAGVPDSVDAQQDAKSMAGAKELAQLLDQAKLDSFAGRDPAQPDQYVAAMYLPGQLLVVSARYAAPVLLDQKIAKKEYRDVYIDLNSAFVANTKVFIEDLNADGLQSKPNNDQPYDTFENGASRLAFDGDWKKQKLSEADYMKAFGEADDRYTKMLAVLVAQLKKPA